MATGHVKWFNPDKGYGFISPDDGTEDRFVHRSGLADPYAADLAEGDRVSFEIGVAPRGPVATGVQVIERSGLPARTRSNGTGAGFGFGDRSGGYDAPRRQSRSFVSEEELASAPLTRGTVKRFDTEKGFGFIQPESGADVFVHQSAAGGLPLRPGEQVEFRVISSERGPRAERVRVLS